MAKRKSYNQKLSLTIILRHLPTWIGLQTLHLITFFPYKFQIFIGRQMGLLMHRLGGHRRHIAEVNIRLCFPELNVQQQKKLVKDSFISVGIGLIETAVSWWSNVEKYQSRIKVSGVEKIFEAQEKGKGVILLGAHFTTLDFGGALLALYGRGDVIYRGHKNPLFNAMMYRGRKRHFEHVFEREQMREIIKSLKAGHIIWYAPDQDYGAKHSVFVPFFGVNAATITATSRLAKINDSPVFMFSHYRQPKGNYLLEITGPLNDFPSEDLIKDAALVNKTIETAIRRYPDQYLWMHRRFKTRPENEKKPYGNKKMKLKKLSNAKYQKMREGATLLMDDRYGEKLIKTANGIYIKFFRRKRLFSSALMYSYATRFANNAKRLQNLDIVTVDVKALYRISSINRTAVAYQPLSGASIREVAMRNNKLSDDLIKKIACFIGLLHKKGIYFRSIHLGNIILTDDNQIGLIDIADMKFSRKSLSLMKRIRNFKHIMRYSKDIALLHGSDKSIFIKSYMAEVKDFFFKQRLERKLNQKLFHHIG